MADDDDAEGLRLNTLDRFRKRSPRLLLEEYSHCEVPAGCGGVVLRWVDPEAGVPAILRVTIVGDGDSQAWIDGELLDSSRTSVSAGERCLAIELSGLGRGPTLLLVELQRGLGSEGYGAGRAVLTRSSADPSWRACPSAEIDDDWMQPSGDGSDWVTLPTSAAAIADQVRNSWQARLMRQAGTAALELSPALIHAGVARIRHRFHVTSLDPAARREEQR